MLLKESFEAPSNETCYMQQSLALQLPPLSSCASATWQVAKGGSRCLPQHIPIQLAAVHVRPGPLSVLPHFKLHIGETTGQVHHLQMHKGESAACGCLLDS